VTSAHDGRRDFVLGVLARLGIEVAPGDAQLRRAWARCPSGNHPDRNPSWQVRFGEPGQRAGNHRCYSCQWRGSLADLVMRRLELGFREAVAWIGDGYEYAGPTPTRAEVGVSVATVQRGFRLPAQVCCDPLDRWVTPMRRYAEERGLTAEQVERWGVGYAVMGPLRGRVVFVARRADGSPARFSARTISRDAREKRYLEANALDGADMTVMFGEQHWPALRRRDGGGATRGEGSTVVVLEGAIKALAVERSTVGCDVEPAVAVLSGSGLHPAHAAKLAAFDRVIVFTDADAAGDKVARELHGTLARHVRVRRLRTEPGLDADRMASDELRKAIEGVAQ
jgi:DNA primase